MNDKTISKNHMPRFLIAAAASGSGKTVITSGLLAALKKRNIMPASFKCGPDYIDPMFHKKVLGVDSLNLDTFFQPADRIRELVNTCGKDIAVIEGVMGIYDGVSPDGIEGSCYEIAKITGTPVILIVNAQGAGRTVASIIKGILSDDDEKLIKGIILNRMSGSYYEKFAPVLEDEIHTKRKDVSVLGYIEKSDKLQIGSRYLGLTMPGEINGILEKLDEVASVLEECCDIQMIIEIAESAEDMYISGSAGIARQDDEGSSCAYNTLSNDRCVRLAVARDEAFCFYYEENLKLLRSFGVEPVFFSPIHDDHIPEGVSGILIGGGYPELYLQPLCENVLMRESVKRAIRSGMPSLAECGGFMYLHDAIEDKNGTAYDMAGVIGGVCKYSGHLVNFGYAEVISADVIPELCGMRGHEFHYYESNSGDSDIVLKKPSTGKEYASMLASDDHLWGFAHFYYPSAPAFIRMFTGKMREYEN